MRWQSFVLIVSIGLLPWFVALAQGEEKDQGTVVDVPHDAPETVNTPVSGEVTPVFPKGWRQLPPVRTIAGKPVFPFGAYVISRPWIRDYLFREYAANGVNTVMLPWPTIKLDMEKARESGLYVILGVHGHLPGKILADDKLFDQNRTEIKDKIRETIMDGMKHPSHFLGLYTYDEPENLLHAPTKANGRFTDSEEQFPDFVKRRVNWAYKIVKQEAPSCPVYMCIG